MRRIKAAVIGTGFIGPAHVEALRRIDGVEVVAIASNELGRARSIAERFEIPRVYDTWAAVISDPNVEVVHNCTPNNLHFEINRETIRAGKHIISEKPLTLTSRESAELVKLVNNSGVVHAVNFNYRFYPLVQHAHELVREGQLGKIYLVHGHYLQDWLYFETDYNWRLESTIGGKSRAVADIGSHWCDLVQFVTGAKITRVCSNLVTFHKTRKKPSTVVASFKGKEGEAGGITRDIPIDTEDAGIVMLELENGALGVVTVSQVSAGRKNREWFEIDGSLESLVWNQEEPNRLWVGHREKPNELIIKDPSLLHENIRRYAHYPGGHPEGYPDGPKNLFANVYEFIREEKDPRKVEPNFPTFIDGHWENLIVEAVLESHRRQKWVDVAS